MHRTALVSLLLLALVQSAALAQTSGAAIAGADGSRVDIPRDARVVSIGAAVTEILYALGLEDRVAGVDTTSVFPPRALRDKPAVGYMRALSAEGVLSVGPDLILAVDGAGPHDTIDLLAKASVPLVSIPNDPRPDAIPERIRKIAAIMGVPARGEALAKAVAQDIAQVAGTVAALDGPPRRAMFLLSLAEGKVMVGGGGTIADGMIALSGATNVFHHIHGYRQVSNEAIIEAAPDAVIMMARGGHAMSPDTVFAHPAFALTPAAKSRAFIAMDSAYLLAFGPRAAHAAHDLARRLHPGATLPALPRRPWVEGMPVATGG